MANSDGKIKINSEAIASACSEFDSKVKSVNLSGFDLGPFSALSECGIGTGYLSSLKNALERVDKLSSNLAKLIESTAYAQEDRDNAGAKAAGNNSYGNASYDRGGGGGSSSGDDAVGAVSGIDPGSTTIGKPKEKVEINKGKNEKQIELETSEEVELVEALQSIKPETLANWDDRDSISKIKKELLKSPNLSDDLKEKIANMDENELKVALSDVFASGKTISDFSRVIISIFDEDLKNDFKNATIYDSADKIKNVLDYVSKQKDFQNEIKEIYLGASENKDVDEHAIILVRSYVDLLATTNNVSYEDILNDSKYQSTLLEDIEDLKDTFYVLSITKDGNNNTKSELSSSILLKKDDVK